MKQKKEKEIIEYMNEAFEKWGGIEIIKKYPDTSQSILIIAKTAFIAGFKSYQEWLIKNLK